MKWGLELQGSAWGLRLGWEIKFRPGFWFRFRACGMHYVTDGPHRDRSTQMLHEFAANMGHQFWEHTRRRALRRACTYKSQQTFTNLALLTPASSKHQRWVWSSGVWVTGTKADGAPAYELRRHPKDRMLIKEMHPRRPHKETRRRVLKSWILNYQNKRIYHQRNHK